MCNRIHARCNTRYRLRLCLIPIQDKDSFSMPQMTLPWQQILWGKSGPVHTTATRDVRTADPSADGRRSAASRTVIGGCISSRRPRGDNCLNRVCRFYPKLRREGMLTGMGMGFQNGSEMGMKFEVIGSWNGKNVTRMAGNVSINCTAAQSSI